MLKSVAQKPHLLKIITPLQRSIVVKGDSIALNNPWHFHPEIELLYCIKGKGTNFIGNCICHIEEGELLLFGKNLPHTRQRDRAYYETKPNESPETIVVQFREEFLGEHFFQMPEFQHVRNLLDHALRGLKFFGATRDEVTKRLKSLTGMDETTSIIELLSILDRLARSPEFIYLNPINYASNAHEKASQKINKVYQYTVAHFREPISLDDVAALTNHSTSAFCRYFKARTRKSYFQYLTETRIAYACELLMEGNMDVSEVCFNSGFNNLSHFHKQFKRIVKITPSEYKSKGQFKVPKS